MKSFDLTNLALINGMLEIKKILFPFYCVRCKYVTKIELWESTLKEEPLGPYALDKCRMCSTHQLAMTSGIHMI